MIQPIGVFDSGIGGLSVLREIHRLLPHEDVVYYADQANVPYGEKTLMQVRQLVEQVVRYLLDQYKVKMVVVACNTASAAALHYLRETFPDMAFVGMEPAIKPAAQYTQTGHIGVLATRATFQGELFASLLDRFAKDTEVHPLACPDFVMLAERGGPYTQDDQRLVHNQLAPLLAAGIDQLVLGCTHFPFLTSLIQEAVGPDVTIVDPSEAVARQVWRVLEAAHQLNPSTVKGQTRYLSSGDRQHFAQQVQTLLGIEQLQVGSL
ncbi:MAG: glutamate racemase [Anaerolineales bacterium]|nr:glutamate racemase [Anaerolineales bacterium]